jgi:hypothetical protein
LVTGSGQNHENAEPIQIIKQNISSISEQIDKQRKHELNLEQSNQSLAHTMKIHTSTTIASKPPKHPFSRKSLNLDISNFEFS